MTSLSAARLATWSGVKSRAMSASPFSTSLRWAAGSGTWRIITLSLAFQARNAKGPEPAAWVLSQPLPRSRFRSCASAADFSITEPTMEDSSASTSEGA